MWGEGFTLVDYIHVTISQLSYFTVSVRIQLDQLITSLRKWHSLQPLFLFLKLLMFSSLRSQYWRNGRGSRTNILVSLCRATNCDLKVCYVHERILPVT